VIHSIDVLIRAGESVLSDRFGNRLSLEAVRVWEGVKSNVVRCSVSPTSSAIPPTVLVKQSKCQSNLEEWAACLFLATLAEHPPLAPLCYGGSQESQLVVLEDFGEGTGPNTHELLMMEDPEAAAQSLIDHMQLLARLHVSTRGRADQYAEMRRALGPALIAKPLFHDPWSNAREEVIPQSEQDRAAREYRESLSMVGVIAPACIDEEIALAAAVEGDPGQFLSLCQGDVNTAESCLRSRSNLRLFDFDSSGFRHAFTEGLAGRLMWGCQLRIPEKVLRMMDDAYRDWFGRSYRSIADDRLYKLAIAQAAARWHVFHVIWRVPTALKENYQRGLSTLREQLIAWLDAFDLIAEQSGHVPGLAHCARQLLSSLSNEWSLKVEELPYYPAFARGSI
jgi:hypothetical protein